MKKILIIIHREYLSRVRKRSFIVMTILGPILMAAMMIVPIYIAQLSDKVQKIQVIDETNLFVNQISDIENIKFEYSDINIDSAKNELKDGNFDLILHINDPRKNGSEFTLQNIPSNITLYSESSPSITVKTYIENSLKKQLQYLWFKEFNINSDSLATIDKNTDIQISTISLSGNGQEEKINSNRNTILGLFTGILIYMFIFLFGSQVMRGVIEEKTSRIVEVIISSVKPFQLMMGKIIGIALVGLTQFLLWIILTFGIVIVLQNFYPETFKFSKTETPMIGNSKVITQEQAQEINASQYKNQEMRDILESVSSINFGVMIATFVFYFLFGYLLYAALFAAVGSAVDNEADTQQFMLPITVPLIFAILMSQFVINNPSGPIAFWLSIIPFTSPIIMMIRLPFGVPVVDQLLSYSLLILGFLFCTWFAGKIYRTGILMYGKKPTYAELWKWLKYKS